MVEGGAGAASSSRRLSERMAGRLGAADQPLLRQRASQAQELRRELLDGATIAIIGAGYSGKRFIYERAAELGVRLILVDRPDHWSEALVDEGIAAGFVPADLYVNVSEQVDQILGGLDAFGVKLDGVCTFWEESVPVAARLAHARGLPGNAPDAVDRARSKRLTLVATQKGGLSTPRFAPIGPLDDLHTWATSVGFPAVIKPEFGVSALGVYRVDSEDELHDAMTRIIPSLVPLNPFGNFSVYGTGFILEEYLDGIEFDIDLLLSDGECVYSSVTENWPTDEPYFHETGLHCPSLFPASKLDELVDISVRGVASLGLQLGVVHVEVKYTSHGPRIVEINDRMGGGSVRDTNLAVRGVDLVEEHIMATVGIPICPVTAPAALTAVAGHSLYPSRSGTLGSTDFIDKLRGDPRVFFAGPGAAAGDHVQAAADGFPTQLIEFALQERDVPTAIEAIRALGAAASVPIL